MVSIVSLSSSGGLPAQDAKRGAGAILSQWQWMCIFPHRITPSISDFANYRARIVSGI